MKRICHFALLLFLFVLFITGIGAQSISQSAPPKLGLCLSGGGAKGLAHIGLLRMLDSLGIRPDYITGTSMGSVLGALYSIGYTGDELKALALKADWSKLLSNKFSLDDINIEEKDEYGRYLLEMPMVRWKPTLPKGLIEGPDLQEYLIGLTFPVRHIQNFDSLPIPFRCVATDIKTGKTVLLKDGSLHEALRSSMAIPLLFSPVERGDYLLVDGGLTRNFPVREVRDMGATKVVGSFTGFRLLDPDELDNGFKMVLQSLSLSTFLHTDDDKKACDVWVNNELPNLYASSFNKVKSIIEGGEANARAMLPQLAEIAAWQRANGVVHKPHRAVADTVILAPMESIDVRSENGDFTVLLKRKFGIEPGQVYTSADLKRGLNQLYGTRFYDKVFLDIEPGADCKSSRIRIRARESAQAVVKTGVHYDTDDGAGILLNGTFRNEIFPDSRISMSLDLAERPKGHFHFYQFIGENPNLRWMLDARGERTVRNDFLFIKASNGKIKSRDKYISDHWSTTGGLQYTINKNSMVFADLSAVREIVKPQRDPRTFPVPNETSFLKNESSGTGLAAGILSNTLNDVFYPDRGHFLQAEVKLGFNYHSDFTEYQYNATSKTGQENKIVTADGQTYIRYRLDARKWIPFSNRWAVGLRAGLGAGLSLRNKLPASNPDTPPLDNPETFYIGGSELSVRNYESSFIGLRKSEIEFSQFLQFGITAQYRASKHIFITPSANIGRFTDMHNALYSHLLDWDLKKDLNGLVPNQNLNPVHILGYGINFGYQSSAGPVNLLIHSNTFTHTFYVFFSFGFKIP
jgi:NTE family protein